MSIVSFPMIEDFSYCNDYCDISLINEGFRILSKIVTKSIVQYAFSQRIIRPEQLDFRNKEECIGLFVSICEICQRGKFNDQFYLFAFLNLKRAYDSIQIYNILTNLNNIGIRGKYFKFITNIYHILKSRANINGKLTKEFPIYCVFFFFSSRMYFNNYFL